MYLERERENHKNIFERILQTFYTNLAFCNFFVNYFINKFFFLGEIIEEDHKHLIIDMQIKI